MAKFEAKVLSSNVKTKKEGRGEDAYETPITIVTLEIYGANTDVAKLVKGYHMVTIAED